MNDLEWFLLIGCLLLLAGLTAWSIAGAYLVDAVINWLNRQ